MNDHESRLAKYRLAKYLSEHAITRELNKRGYYVQDLALVELCEQGPSAQDPFENDPESWAFTLPPSVCMEDFTLLQAFARLKWFVANQCETSARAEWCRSRLSTLVAQCEASEMRKPGVLLARIRHEQTYMEHKKVTDYWRNNVDPKLSAQKAADAILQAGVTTLSHKKIAEIVSTLRNAERIRKK